jgi:anti-anti-sigma factor
MGFAVTQTASLSSAKVGEGVEVFTLHGECDATTALLAEQYIASALDAGTTEIIFDLRAVTTLDRSMLQVLFRALIRIGQNGTLLLVRPSASVWALFEETGMDKGFSTVADLEAALSRGLGERKATARRLSATTAPA